MKKILFVLFAFITIYDFKAQISEGGIPPGILFAYKSATHQEMLEMPLVDTNKLKSDDLLDSASKLKPFRYAVNHQVQYSISNSGKWSTLGDGSRLWTLRLRSKHAYSLVISFSEFHIPENAKLFLYDQDKTYILGAFTSINNNIYDLLTVSPIPGDMVTIEYVIPADAIETGRLAVGLVGHDYKNAFRTLKDANYGLAASCEVDIRCDLGKDWQIEKNSVCRLVIPKSDGNTYLCTGTMVNNTAQDGTPYLLSANHCVTDQYAASRMLVGFNYESALCKGPDVSSQQTVAGGTLKATTSKLDFSLTQLNQMPPFSYYPYFAGWNINTTGITKVVAIHHPRGDVKKISVDNAVPVQDNFGLGYNPNTHWKIGKWDIGATEGGSSGGPLFDQEHHVIGDLSGGGSKCGCILDCSDYYAMISHSWSDYPSSSQQLKTWLDPKNYNSKKLNGIDPYLYYKKTCDTLSNITAGETPVLLSQPGWGYYAGISSDKPTQFAEAFQLADSSNLVGFYMNVAKNAYTSIYSFIYIHVWSIGTDSLPSKILYSKIVYLNTLKSNSKQFIPFSKPFKRSGIVYIGFEISYDSPLDTFALYSSPKRFGGSNSQYIFVSNQWVDRKTFSGFGLSMDIKPVFCDSLPVDAFPLRLKSREAQQSAISCYPNPSEGNIKIQIPESSGMPVDLEIYNITGTNVLQKKINSGVEEYSCTLEQSGVYIVRLSCEKWVQTCKIMINR